METYEREQLTLDFDTPERVRLAEFKLNEKTRPIWDRESFSEEEQHAWADLIFLLVDDDTDESNYLLKAGGNQPSEKKVKRLLGRIINEYPSNLQGADVILRILRRVILKGGALKVWSLQPTPTTVHAPREKNRFTPERFKRKAHYNLWVDYLKKALNHKTLSWEGQIGRILLSAILNGGLLSSHLMVGLLRAISSQSPLRLLNEQGYISLNGSWLGHAEVEVRHWYPDSMTQALILNFELPEAPLIGDGTLQGKLTQTVFGYIKTLLQQIGVKRKHQPRNISALIDVVALNLELKMPPFVVDYLKREHLSHTLRDSAIRRLQAKPVKDLEQSDVTDLDLSRWTKGGGATLKNEKTSSLDDSGLELEWIKTLNKEALGHDWQGFKSILYGLIEDIPKEEQHTAKALLLKWAMYLMEVGNEQGKRYAPITVRSYLVSLARRLCPYLEQIHVTTMRAEELEETYTQVLDDIESRGERRKQARALSMFQAYLEQQHHVEPIDRHGVLGIQSSPAPVDANIIWIDEFEALLRYLEEGQLEKIHPDLVPITQCIAVLGYRCGLRRNETLKLRLIDIQGKANQEVLVRPHSERRLKTTSSQRRIPLRWFLEEKELTALMEWKARRVAQEKNRPSMAASGMSSQWAGSPYLFAIPDKGYTFAPEDLVFPAIHQAMRKATNDASVRYHHFRHSFASLNLMRLMVADHGMPAAIFDQQPKTKQWLESGTQLKQALYAEEGPTRKHLYYISALLGHSSPSISLEHYIHLMDVISMHLLRKHLPPEKSMLVSAAEENEKTVYRWLKKGEQEYNNKIRWKKRERFPELNAQLKADKTNQQDHQAQRLESDEDRYSPYREIIRLKNLLYSHQVHGLDLTTLSDRSGLEYLRIQKALERAEHLASLTSGKKTSTPESQKKTYRLRMQEVYIGDEKQRIACPAEIQNNPDKKMAETLCSLLDAYEKEQPEQLQKWVAAWLENTWATKQWVVFKDTKTANEFINTLLAINIPKEWIRLSLLHGQESEPEWITRSLKAWKKDMPKTAKLEWLTSPVSRGKRMGVQGWLGINLMNRERGTASEAARFVMAMWLIGLGWEY